MSVNRVPGQAAQSTAFTNNTQRAVALPNPAGSGNLIWAWLTLYGVAPTGVTAPAGWTLIASHQHGTNDWWEGVWYKITGGSEPASYTWTWTGNAFPQYSFIEELSALDVANPIDVADVWRELGNFAGTSFTAPAITLVSADTYEVALLVDQAQGPGYNFAATPAFTELNDSGGMGIYSRINSAAGSSGTAAVTVPAGFSADVLRFAIAAGITAPPSPSFVEGLVNQGHRPAPMRPGGPFFAGLRRRGRF